MRRTGLAALLIVLLGSALAASAANLERGIALFERGRFEQAAETLAPLAGDTPQAQYVLGLMYHNLMAEPPEEGAGLALMTAAGEAGYLPAQSELGRIYRDGDGVDQDFAKAMRWYERAAGAGDVGAQLFVADGYAYGMGVARDRVEAYKWYEIAIRYWGPLAEGARAMVAEEMSAAEIAEAQRRAEDWLAGQGAE